MKTIDHWRDLLDEARSEGDVLSIAYSFLLDLPEEERRLLPWPCEPYQARDPDFISRLAVDLTLAAHRFDGDARTREVVWNASAVFAEAALRLSQLQHDRPSPPAMRLHPAVP